MARGAYEAAAHRDKRILKRVVGQFAVAALYERRNLVNQNPAVIDRRYKKPK
jgi:hypothetical protein